MGIYIRLQTKIQRFPKDINKIGILSCNVMYLLLTYRITFFILIVLGNDSTYQSKQIKKNNQPSL